MIRIHLLPSLNCSTLRLLCTRKKLQKRIIKQELLWNIIEYVRGDFFIDAFFFFQVQVRLFIPQSYLYGSSDLWAEFFGTVHDSLGRIAEFGPLNNILGRCLLVRIMEMKSDCDTSSNWVVHKVLHLLEVCKFCGTQEHIMLFYNLYNF